jgi:excisionase family DNA binding protein
MRNYRYMELQTEPRTMTVEEAGRVLGVGRAAAYAAAKSGDLPTIRVGRRLLVPRQRLAELLGETNENSATAANRDAVQNLTAGVGHDQAYPD